VVHSDAEIGIRGCIGAGGAPCSVTRLRVLSTSMWIGGALWAGLWASLIAARLMVIAAVWDRTEHARLCASHIVVCCPVGAFWGVESPADAL